MRIKLSYIGINTDNPTPIILTDADVAIVATRESVQHAIVEVDKFKSALNEAYSQLFGSTLDQDEAERARKQVRVSKCVYCGDELPNVRKNCYGNPNNSMSHKFSNP